jgi:hypothetical protein
MTKFMTPAKFSSWRMVAESSRPIAPEHQPGDDQGRKHRDEPERREVDAEAQRDSQEHVDLDDRHARPGEQLADQQIPPRQRRRQQDAHAAHLPVVDHGQ